MRAADVALQGAFSPWQLSGAGAVGSQVIMGMPMLARLRRAFVDLTVWPFAPPTGQIVLAETYFSQLRKTLAARAGDGIKDAAQVALYAEVFSGMNTAEMSALLNVDSTPEGWVLGAGLLDDSPLQPPPLRNDCFAMPQGAHWTPVDDALAHLRAHLAPVTSTQVVALQDAHGRYLAEDVKALRAHPPAPNAAVDGYAMRGPIAEGAHLWPLYEGRAAAGAPFDGTVPEGHALRILTGANLPDGADTVILQEDVTAQAGEIAFHGPLKKGANARNAGEDIQPGQTILQKGRKITAADLATMAATGIGTVTVHARLKVGILSTGDELVAAGDAATVGQIYDANRPMLLADVAAWGHVPVDLGRAPDDRAALRAILDDAASRCDVILSSGGASAGDEDHMSALLEGTGSLALWRIAMKPGRPLATGLWEYLRARITDGVAEVFPSEGSGRVSGLSWATGLVVLGDDAATIAQGDLVQFIPFESFGR